MTPVKHSKEATVKANNIDIVYDTFGEPSAPPLLLIIGLGTQMIRWDEAFCEQLAEQGYWVIRFDNRDMGLSTKFDEADVPDVMALMQALQQGETLEVPYTLLDMANDTIGFLDALKIETAHVIGISMGGMIAQTIAIHYPERVRTLTSIMSATGSPEFLLPPDPEAIAILTTPPPVDREENIENTVQMWRLLNGPKFPFDETYFREYAARAYDRNFYPAGTARQLAAILAAESRKEELKRVKVPTLVIHGNADPLVPVEGGIDTAEAIPGAELKIIEGMGHSIPVEVAPQIIEAIKRHAV
ncbi:MAG: alpha/beta fold hydrolase [Promethearchaeota archaeon]